MWGLPSITPDRFTSDRSGAGTEWITGRVGYTAGLDVVQMKIIFNAARIQIRFFSFPARSLPTMPTELSDSQQKVSLNGQL